MKYTVLFLLVLTSLVLVAAKDEEKQDDDAASIEVSKDDEQEDAVTRADIGKTETKVDASKKKADDAETTEQISESADDAADEEAAKTNNPKKKEKQEEEKDKSSKKQFGCAGAGLGYGIPGIPCGGGGGPQGCLGGPPGFYPGDLWEYPYPYYHPVYNLGTACCPCACACNAKPTKVDDCSGADDEKEAIKEDPMFEKGGGGKIKKKVRKQLVPSHYYGCPSAGWGGFLPGHTGGGWGAPYWYKSMIPTPNDSDESGAKKFGITVHGDHDVGLWDHGWGAGYGHPWGAPVADSGFYGGFPELAGSQYGGYSHGVSGWGAGQNIGLLGWGRGWGYPVNGDISGWGGGLPHGWGEGLHHAGGASSFSWGTGLAGHHPEEGWVDTGHNWPEGLTSGMEYPVQAAGTPYGHHGFGGLFKSKVPGSDKQKDASAQDNTKGKNTAKKAKVKQSKA